MGNNDNGPGGWWMRQPPSQITEKREAGLPVDFTLPVLQAVAPGALLGWCLFVTGATLWAAAPASLYLLAVVFSAACIIFHVHWLEPWRALAGALAACVVAWALGRLLAWIFPWQPWGRYATGVLLCVTAGSWLAFALLSVAFTLELAQRSGAMEEHGWRGFFEWLFGYLLRRERPKPEPPPVVRVELTEMQEDGRVRVMRNFDLPVSLEKMQAVARLVLNGVTFSEPNMAGKGKPLSEGTEYEALREVLLKHGWLQWRSDGARTQGAEFTRPGLAALRHFLDGKATPPTPPHPTPYVREGGGTNECERTNANER